jgi:CDP-diacylglycerol---glycerol-3-phosphate 3-phosphatidyltransferase
MNSSARSKLHFVTFLTFVRFPLVLLFFAAALVNAWRYETWLFSLALGALITSAVTDMFDGYFARKFNVVTGFGEHADPLMDKFFYLVTLPLLVFLAGKNGNEQHAVVLLVMTLLFLVRDQWVTFLRSIGSMYNVSGGANWAGKLRTVLNFPLICTIYYVEGGCSFQFIPMKLLYFYEGIGVAMTILSIYVYTSKYWPSLIKSAQPKQ